MSRLTQMLAEQFRNIKEAIKRALDHIKERDYQSKRREASEIAREIRYGTNSDWEAHWTSEEGGIKADDYCKLKDKIAELITRLQNQWDDIEFAAQFSSVTDASSMRETQTKVGNLIKKFKELKEILKALCTLKVHHKAFSDLADAYAETD